MNRAERFDVAMAACPLVAILRGVRPDEVVSIADVLVEVGFSMIEVPLNSPDPLQSIAAIANRYAAPVLVGAGTVLDIAQVQAVSDAGGRLIVSPNTNTTVIKASADADMVSLPGYATPSEAFAAIGAGASGLKLFPAEASSPAVLRAHRAVLPRSIAVLVVGGVVPSSMEDWSASGADGFGLGGALYSADTSPSQVAAKAKAFIEAWRSIAAKRPSTQRPDL